jgi:hypothetical protein
MATIIKKKELDLMIENTLKSEGVLKETKKPTKKVVKEEVKKSPVKKVVKESTEDKIKNNLLKEELDKFNRIINHRIK